MNQDSFIKALKTISKIMEENKMMLIELDQQNGDGDLGISMDAGFKAVAADASIAEQTDLGILMMRAASVLNEAAPSTLGTVLSIGMLGMGRSLKGLMEADLCGLADALMNGIESIMEKANSKPGEKTILDSLYPAAVDLKENCGKSRTAAFEAAYNSAVKGVESTREMRPIHGRAAYYGENSIGLVDGGAVAGMLIIRGIWESSMNDNDNGI